MARPCHAKLLPITSSAAFYLCSRRLHDPGRGGRACPDQASRQHMLRVLQFLLGGMSLSRKVVGGCADPLRDPVKTTWSRRMDSDRQTCRHTSAPNSKCSTGSGREVVKKHRRAISSQAADFNSARNRSLQGMSALQRDSKTAYTF